MMQDWHEGEPRRGRALAAIALLALFLTAGVPAAMLWQWHWLDGIGVHQNFTNPLQRPFGRFVPLLAVDALVLAYLWMIPWMLCCKLFCTRADMRAACTLRPHTRLDLILLDIFFPGRPGDRL
jgi:hypothetical protein